MRGALKSHVGQEGGALYGLALVCLPLVGVSWEVPTGTVSHFILAHSRVGKERVQECLEVILGMGFFLLLLY